MCEEINTAMLQRIGKPVHTLTASDTLDTIVDQKLLPKILKALQMMDTDASRTAGLEKNIQLCVGARVMLKRNKDVEAGLVNGSVGIVEDFRCTTNDDSTTIDAILVKFTNIHDLVAMKRESCSFEVLKGIFYTRKQLPLMPAFGITIHKSQGLSLSSVIVDAGASIFGCGMIYVALSRVTSLAGLHLIDLDRKKIQCDKKAVDEYNRLHKLYAPHLGIITSETVNNIFKNCNIESVNIEHQEKNRQNLKLL